jgi:hypothetical protein
MGATVQIHEMTSTDTGVDKTTGTVRFKSAISTTVDTSDRLQIPGSGEDWSYTKQLRFYFSVGPTTDIQNLRAYTDGGGFGTGIAVDYSLAGAFATQTDADIAGTNLFSATSGAVIDLDTVNTGPHTSTGYKGDYLRLQMGVADTASPGALAAETLTFAYDET